MRDANEAFWAAALKPFFMLFVLIVVGIPITMAVRRWMPESRLKRLLLDRTLMARKPWIGWAGFFLAYAVFALVIWLVVIFRS